MWPARGLASLGFLLFAIGLGARVIMAVRAFIPGLRGEAVDNRAFHHATGSAFLDSGQLVQQFPEGVGGLDGM